MDIAAPRAQVWQSVGVNVTTHHDILEGRTGYAEWTATSLQDWLVTLAGQPVEVVERPRALWGFKAKRVTFDVRVEATLDRIGDWEGKVLPHLKLRKTEVP